MNDSSKTKTGIGLILAFLAVAGFVGILLGGAASSCFWGLMRGCELDLGDSGAATASKSGTGGKKSADTGTGYYNFDSNLRKKDLRRKDLSNLDLSEADLREADLRYAKLRDTNLSEADLRKADFRFADLTGADLTSAKLQLTDFSQANLSLANFQGNRNLRSGIFRGAWAWSDELPVGLVGKAAVRICDTDLRDDYDSENKSGKPRGC